MPDDPNLEEQARHARRSLIQFVVLIAIILIVTTAALLLVEPALDSLYSPRQLNSNIVMSL